MQGPEGRSTKKIHGIAKLQSVISSEIASQLSLLWRVGSKKNSIAFLRRCLHVHSPVDFVGQLKLIPFRSISPRRAHHRAIGNRLVLSVENSLPIIIIFMVPRLKAKVVSLRFTQIATSEEKGPRIDEEKFLQDSRLIKWKDWTIFSPPRLLRTSSNRAECSLA